MRVHISEDFILPDGFHFGKKWSYIPSGLFVKYLTKIYV
jgi:hypothetical protein